MNRLVQVVILLLLIVAAYKLTVLDQELTTLKRETSDKVDMATKEAFQDCQRILQTDRYIRDTNLCYMIMEDVCFGKNTKCFKDKISYCRRL